MGSLHPLDSRLSGPLANRNRLVRWAALCVTGLLVYEILSSWRTSNSSSLLPDGLPFSSNDASRLPSPETFRVLDQQRAHRTSRLKSVDAVQDLDGGIATDIALAFDVPPDDLQIDAAWRVCSECSDERKGGYLPRQQLQSSATSAENAFRSNTTTKADMFRHIHHNVLLASNFEAVFLPNDVRLQLLDRSLTHPDSLLSFSFAGLKPDIPTLFMYTRTADAGRLKGATRMRYMNRHIDLIRNYTNIVRQQGYGDGRTSQDVERQLLWIVVEDAPRTDESLERLLRSSNVPYLYFSHGPTNRWGKAQWNIVLKAVDVLTHSVFGDGPVVNVDDDAYFMPEALRRMWKVKKMIAWQAGNFPLYRDFAPSEWEGPFYENGKLTKWHYGGRSERHIRIDMNAFAINSTMVGEGRPIHGPQYVPHNNPAGESEFAEMIYEKEEDLEPLCDNTREEKCYWVWHNHWMPEDWDAEHRPPTRPDY